MKNIQMLYSPTFKHIYLNTVGPILFIVYSYLLLVINSDISLPLFISLNTILNH